jgi:hypothetical protein
MKLMKESKKTVFRSSEYAPVRPNQNLFVCIPVWEVSSSPTTMEGVCDSLRFGGAGEGLLDNFCLLSGFGEGSFTVFESTLISGFFFSGSFSLGFSGSFGAFSSFFSALGSTFLGAGSFDFLSMKC